MVSMFTIPLFNVVRPLPRESVLPLYFLHRCMALLMKLAMAHPRSVVIILVVPPRLYQSWGQSPSRIR